MRSRFPFRFSAYLMVIAPLFLVIPKAYLLAKPAESSCIQSSEAEQFFGYMEKASFPLLLNENTKLGTRKIGTSEYLSKVLDLKERPHLIEDFQELRFLPYTMSKMHLILLSSGTQLDRIKIRKVARVAKRMKIKISYLGLESPSEELLSLVTMSGGQVFDSSFILNKICAAPVDS